MFPNGKRVLEKVTKQNTKEDRNKEKVPKHSLTLPVIKGKQKAMSGLGGTPTPDLTTLPELSQKLIVTEL